MQYSAHIEIDAAPDVVWKHLTQVDKWPQWDPFCDKIEGEVALGNTVKAFSKLSPGRAFGVKVSVLEAPKTMVWSGGMPLGLFKGERTFSLNPNAEGGTSFSMREVFSGPMLFLIGRSIPDMTEAFEAFVQGLKTQSES